MSRCSGLIRRLPGLRRRWALIALALALALAAWLAWQPMSGLFLPRDETWARIQRDRVVRVGMDASYPPFDLVDDAGRFSGFDVDLATALAERWGCTPQFVNIHFDGLYDALEAGKVDLILSALPYDRMMTRDVLYSQSYFNAGQVLVARRNEAGFQTVKDLEGRRLVVELGAEGHQLARRLVRDEGVGLTILPQREPEQVLVQLREGEADAALCDRVTAYSYLRERPDLCLVGAPLTDEPYVIATRWEATQLLAEINSALNEWRGNGFLATLGERWF